MTRIYRIHDNGGRPFIVVIKSTKVIVYGLDRENTYDDNITYLKKPIMVFKPKKIFVGKSPHNKMTEFSGGYGPGFDGNSMLFKLKKNVYLHVGEMIFTFKTHNEIKMYVSPVGNSDVPYPYAIDIDNNYYLMTEKCVLLNNNLIKKFDDPYDFYYKVSTAINKSKHINAKTHLDIEKIYIGARKCEISYNPTLAEQYRYRVDRTWSGDKKKIKKIYIKLHGKSDKILVSRHMFNRIINTLISDVKIEKLKIVKVYKKRFQ